MKSPNLPNKVKDDPDKKKAAKKIKKAVEQRNDILHKSKGVPEGKEAKKIRALNEKIEMIREEHDL